MEYQFHPLANIFPLMEGDDLQKLADDISKHGLKEPIQIYDGKVIDGRNRYRACLLAGKELATFEEIDFEEIEDAISHVVSLNLKRRHLDESQRGLAAAKARGLYEEAAKQRHAEGSHKGGLASPSNKGVAQVPHPCKSRPWSDDAAKDFNVSPRTVRSGNKVLKHGSEELINAVEKGEVKLKPAEEIAKLRKEEQPKAIEKHKESKKTRKDKEIEEEPEPGVRRGFGIQRAHEAIACLKQIPQNDPLRNRGFQIVTDWIRHNK